MKRLNSVLTDDMDHCYFTGTPVVERHHIFGGPNKRNSDTYGFIIPLAPELHPNGAHATWDSKLCAIDTCLKQMAQFYYERYYGTRAKFIREFGKSYLLNQEE